MNRVKVFTGLALIILANIFIITTRNLTVLILAAGGAYGVGFFIDSPKVTLKRVQVFFFIGASIILFQLIFASPLNFRTILQISTISEIIFVSLKWISPSEIISAFSFLPPAVIVLFSMTFYFIPLLTAEQNTIRLVQRSRGTKNSPLAFLLPLLHRIFQRAETVSLTILSRGFKND